MGTLAFAGATSHVGAIVKDADADPERSPRLAAAWDTMDDAIRRAELDAVVLVATDHYETFSLDNYPIFCLGLANSHEGWGEFGNPAGTVAGRPEIAAQVLEGLVHKGFDVSASHSMRLDHSFMVPITRLPSIADAGVIPFFMNCNTPPLPTLRRCHALGAAIREVVEGLPGDARVGVIGTGGISHWVGLPQFGDINENFDREFTGLLSAGEIEKILDWSDERILAEGGNGALEIRTWLTAVGAAGPGAKVTASSYEPMYSWGIGIGVLTMNSTTAAAPIGGRR